METISRLKALGHRIEGHNRVLFGRGQIICARSGGQSGERVWSAGSDARELMDWQLDTECYAWCQFCGFV